MKILKLKLFQETACYKKPFAFKVAETYPLPPYSTVIGMFHKILQVENYIPMNISVQGDYESIFNNYIYRRKFLTDREKKKYNNSDFINKPLNEMLLLNINLIIHVKAGDEIIDKIYYNIVNGVETFTLGRNEDIVRIDEIKIVNNVKRVEGVFVEKNAYIPEWMMSSGIHGINYRLNSKYTIENDLRKWEKIDVKFVEKNTSEYIEEAIQDEDGDNIYFYIEG